MFCAAFIIFSYSSSPNPAEQLWGWTHPLLLSLDRCFWRTLEPNTIPILYGPALTSQARQSLWPQISGSAPSLDPAWFTSICVISSVFPLDTPDLVEFQPHGIDHSLPSLWVWFNPFDSHLISQLLPALFLGGLQAFCVFYLHLPGCDIYFIPGHKPPSAGISRN